MKKELSREEMVDFIADRVVHDREIPEELEELEEDINELLREWVENNPCDACDIYSREVGDLSEVVADELESCLDMAGKLEVLVEKGWDESVRDAVKERLEELDDDEVREIYCRMLGEAL